MNEETKVTKKTSFKDKVKKILPYAIGAVGTVGGSILSYKLGKKAESLKHTMHDREIIARYLNDHARAVADGGDYAFHVLGGDGTDFWASLVTSEEKPDWVEDQYREWKEWDCIITDEVESLKK